jgi:hypothetical protein
MAILAGTDGARSFLAQYGTPDFAYHPEGCCTDISKPRPVYFDEHKQGVLHSAADQYALDEKASGWVRDGSREKVGTISVSRPR